MNYFVKPLTSLALLVSVSTAVNAATISLSTDSTTVQIGDTFAVDLQIDFTDEATLGGGLDVIYDDSLADFVSFTFNSEFAAVSDASFSCPGAFLCPDIDQAGTVSNIAFGNFAGIGGVFTVGTLEFVALTAGIIDLTPTDTADVAGPFVSASTFGPMTVDYQGVSVTSVPVPAGVWLFASAIGGLIAQRSRLS